MEVLFVTSNYGKVASLKRVLAPFGHTVKQRSLVLLEPQADLRTIAKHKANAAMAEVKPPFIVQDTGFFLDAWRDFPGAFVGPILETLNFEGLLVLVEDRIRSCEFRECLAYHDGQKIQIFEASIRGILATEARGSDHPEAWSRLWKLFVPEGYTMTIAEMDEKERAEWRRTRKPDAATKFAQWLALHE
jgi:XTP/dITP diphosphohydrolase